MVSCPPWVPDRRSGKGRLIMTATLTVYDETASGQRTGELSLDFLTERVTARELIRSRIYQEVQDYNTKRPDHF